MSKVQTNMLGRIVRVDPSIKYDGRDDVYGQIADRDLEVVSVVQDRDHSVVFQVVDRTTQKFYQVYPDLMVVVP